MIKKIANILILAAKPLIAISITAVIVLYFAAKINSISNFLVEKGTAEAKLEQRIIFIDQIKRDLDTIGADNINKVKEALPLGEPGVLEFLTAMDEAGRINSIKQDVRLISGISEPEFNTDSAQISSIDFTVNLETYLDKLIRYLDVLDSMPFFTPISSIAINSSTENGWLDNSQIFIKSKVYVKQSPKTE